MAAVKGSKCLMTEALVSVRKTVEVDGKHAYIVGLTVGSSESSSRKCKKFEFDHEIDGDDDDEKACARAFRFATSTDQLPMFRSFLLDDGSTSGYGSSADSEESIGRGTSMESGFDSNYAAFGSLSHQRPESREFCQSKPVPYVCLRKNTRVGLKFAVALARAESGQYQAISFQMSRHDLHEEGNARDEELLNRVVTFLRSVTFDRWRKDGASRCFSQWRQHAELALKHPYTYIGIEEGEKVDCICGENWSKGLMVACEECGVWEHAECLGYRFNSQIPADYVCSACVRAQNEEIVFIRLGEQEEGQLKCLYDDLSDAKESGRPATEGVCCICGCEDNEDFETMMHPCSCNGNFAFAHPNCVSSALESGRVKERAKLAAASSTCPLCGGQGFVFCGNNGALASLKSGKDLSPPKSAAPKRNLRSSNSEKSLKGVKCLQSASIQTGVERKNELIKNTLSSSNTCKANRQPEVTVVGRRFADAAVTVPIKKRRIQLMETVRSPSPPPRVPSPSLQRDDLVVKDGEVKVMVGKIDDKQLETMQDNEVADLSLLKNVETMALKGLEAESRNLKTELTLGEEQWSCEKNKKGKFRGRFAFRKGENNSLVAQMDDVKDEIKETRTDKVDDLKGQLHAKACVDMVMVTGDETTALSCSLGQKNFSQDVQVCSSNTSEEMSKRSCKHEEFVLEKPKIQEITDFRMGEEGRKFYESDPGLHRKSQKGSSVGPLEAAENFQGQQNVASSFSEVSVGSKQQELDESNHAIMQDHDQDDRSHWDLNREMDAWDRSCAKLSDVHACLAKTDIPSLDCLEDGEMVVSPVSQESIKDSIAKETSSGIGNLYSEVAHEKLRTEASSKFEPSTIVKHAPVLTPSNTGRIDHDVSLNRGKELNIVRTVPSSEIFDQPRSDSRLPSACEDRAIDDSCEENAADFKKPYKDILLLEKSCGNNPAFDETSEVEGKHCCTVDENQKSQAPNLVCVASNIAADALECILQPVLLAEDLASRSTPECIVDSKNFQECIAMTNFQVDARKHVISSEIDLVLRAVTLNNTGKSIVKPQVDPSKNSNNDSCGAKVISPGVQETDEKRDFVGSDAFEEDDPDADSPKIMEDLCEGEDNEDEVRQIKLFSWNEGVGDDLEAEDVDYGDSENEDEQGHADGGSDDFEADDLASADSQEMEFEDHEADICKEAQSNRDVQEQNAQYLDAGIDSKLNAKCDAQCNLNMDLRIPENDEDAPLQINPFKENQEATDMDIRGTQSCGEELVDYNATNVTNSEESGEVGSENLFNALSPSKKTSSAVLAKPSGWDQLPEGFEKAEDALRAVKESVPRGGRGYSRGSYFAGGGLGMPFQMDARFGKRGRVDIPGHSRFNHRIEDNYSQRFTPKEFGMGRGHSRGGSSVVLRGSRVDSWVNGAGEPQGQWASNRHPSHGTFGENPGFGQRGHVNAAVAAAAKLESSGFVVAPDGTIIKAVNAGNALRGAGRVIHGGAHRGRGVVFDSGTEAMVRADMNFGPGRGFGFHPGMRGNTNSSAGMKVDGYPGIRARVSDPSRLSNQRLIEQHHFARLEHSLSRPVSEHVEKWNRREQYLSPAMLKPSRSSSISRSHRRSRSRSRSRSRTKSPHLRTTPKFGNGIGGLVFRRGHLPLQVRSVVRGESRDSSPSGHLLNTPPKHLLPSSSAHGQCSPPVGSNMLPDRRDRERKYADLELARLNSQSHMSSKRLSSHIEHSVAMFDHHDQQASSSMQSSVSKKQNLPSSSVVSMEFSGKPTSELQRFSGNQPGDGSTHDFRKDDRLLKEYRFKDIPRQDEGERDQRTDGGFPGKMKDYTKRIFSSREDGRTSNNFRYSSSTKWDEGLAPRRRRATS